MIDVMKALDGNKRTKNLLKSGSAAVCHVMNESSLGVRNLPLKPRLVVSSGEVIEIPSGEHKEVFFDSEGSKWDFAIPIVKTVLEMPV